MSQNCTCNSICHLDCHDPNCTCSIHMPAVPDIKEPWNKGGYIANVNDPPRGIHADLIIQDDIITTPEPQDNSISAAVYLLTQNGYIVEKWPEIKSPKPQGETYEQLCRMHKTDLIELLRAAREPQLWIANTDKVPSLSTKPHEICDPITAEEVVKMWDTLKSHYLALQEEIEKNEEKFLIATNPNPDQRPSCRY
jgi:hypothetical protein